MCSTRWPGSTPPTSASTPAARCPPTSWGSSSTPPGGARALTAFATGFRAGELAALTPAHFHLADDPPGVSLPGKVTKNKKVVRHPLPPAVAVALRAHLAGAPRGAGVWPGKWRDSSAAILRGDLEAAGVPYCVEGVHGKEYADFHALRHTFVSALAAAGTGAKELQTLARHSDPRLTLGTYSHARSAELVKAVSRLKVPGTADSPLAALDRDPLEGIALGLAVLLGTLLRAPAPPGARLCVHPGVHLRWGFLGTPGDFWTLFRRSRRGVRK